MESNLKLNYPRLPFLNSRNENMRIGVYNNIFSKGQLTLIASFVPSILLCLFLTWEYFTPSPMPLAEQYDSALVFGFILVGNYVVSPVFMLGFSNSIAQDLPLLKKKNIRLLIELLVVLLYIASGTMFLVLESSWGFSIVTFLNPLIMQGLVVLLPNALSALLIMATVFLMRTNK